MNEKHSHHKTKRATSNSANKLMWRENEHIQPTIPIPTPAPALLCLLPYQPYQPYLLLIPL